MAASTSTELEICNQALLYVGNGQTINGFDEETQEAKASAVHYVKVRDALLESFPWKFATKRAVLAEVSGPENETAFARSGWPYSYELPADCITPRRIWAGTRTPNAMSKIPFDIEGSLLLTDQGAAELIYTRQEDNVALYSPLFVDALAWALAVRFCLVLPVKPEWAKNAKMEAELAWRKAGAAQNRGSQEDPEPPSQYTSAR